MRELHAYKRAQGYPMVDPAREQLLLDAPRRRRTPARSATTALRELWAALLALMTREAARLLDEAGR